MVLARPKGSLLRSLFYLKKNSVGPVDPHVEYVNVVLALSCDDFWQIMWNPANEIWQQMMIREEIRDYTIRKYSDYCTLLA